MDTKTEIDLMPFCDASLSRYSLQSPFFQGGWQYGTDSKIIARLPSSEPDTVPEAGGKLPKCADIFDRYGRVTEWSELPPVSNCAECGGTGKANCKHCRGQVEHRCACGHDHECDNCMDGKVTCRCYVEFGNHHVATWLSEKIRALPGVQWGVDPDDPGDRIFFRFDQGGSGCVMPLRQDS